MREATQRLVLMEAYAEVAAVMRGIEFPFSEKGNKAVPVPFTELSRREKIGLLNTAVDWNLYSEVGLKSFQAWRIVENASDGRPQEQWLEPIQPRHEPPERPNLDALMRRYALPECAKKAERNIEPDR